MKNLIPLRNLLISMGNLVIVHMAGQVWLYRSAAQIGLSTTAARAPQ
jgi:hypothetical protein